MAAPQYPKIDYINQDLFANSDNANIPLNTLLDKSLGTAVTSAEGIQFLTPNNATILQTFVNASSSNNPSNSYDNINSSASAITDVVRLENAQNLSNVIEFQYKVTSGTAAGVVGSFNDKMTLELVQATETDVNDAKILNSGKCSLNVGNAPSSLQTNKKFNVEGLSLEGTNTTDISVAQNAPNVKAEIVEDEGVLLENKAGVLVRVHSDAKAQVQIVPYVSSSVSPDPLNEGYVQRKVGSNFVALEEMKASADYDTLFNAEQSAALPKKWKNLDVVVDTTSSSNSFESPYLSLDQCTFKDNYDGEYPSSLSFSLSRDASSLTKNGDFDVTHNVESVSETLPVDAAGHTSDDMVITLAPRSGNDRFSTSNNLSGKVSNFSLDLAKAPANASSSDVNVDLSKKSVSSKLVSNTLGGLSAGSIDNFVNADANYALHLAVGNEVGIQSFDIDEKDGFDQSKVIANSDLLAGGPSINVGSVSVSGVIAKTDAQSIRILFTPNSNADSSYVADESASSFVKAGSAVPHLEGISSWTVAGDSDIFDSVNRKYNSVVTSYDSAEPEFKLILSNQVTTSYGSGELFQRIVAKSSLKSFNQVSQQYGQNIAMLLKEGDDYTVSTSTANREGGGKRVTHSVKVLKHLIGGLNYNSVPANGFYTYTLEVDYDSNNKLVNPLNQASIYGDLDVVFDVNAYSHTASLQIGNNSSGSLALDLRQIPKDFSFKVSELTVSLASDAAHKQEVINYANGYFIPLRIQNDKLGFTVKSLLIPALQQNPSSSSDFTSNELNLSASVVSGTNNKIQLKNSDDSTVATLTLSKDITDSSNANIFVISRPFSDWKYEIFVNSVSQKSEDLHLKSGQNLSVSSDWLSFDVDKSALEASDASNNMANLSLSKDKYSVVRWIGNKTVDNQELPSPGTELSGTGSFSIKLAKVRGFSDTDKLTVSRPKLMFDGLAIDPMYNGESERALSDRKAKDLSLSSLLLKLKSNPDVGSNLSYTLTVGRPSVNISVSDPDNSDNVVMKASAVVGKRLAFSDMTWTISVGASDFPNVAPFSSMFHLKNINLAKPSDLEIQIRSPKLYATEQLNIYENVDTQNSKEITASMDSKADGVFFGNETSNKRYGISIYNSVADENLILEPTSVYYLLVPTLYKFNYVNEEGKSQEEIGNLNDLLKQSGQMAEATFNQNSIKVNNLLEKLTADVRSFNLTVPKNKFSVQTRLEGNTDWINRVDQKLLSDADFVSDSPNGWVYKFTDDSNDSVALLRFKNELQRPLDWSSTLKVSTSKVFRLHSWHLQQCNNKVTGDIEFQLVRLASAAKNLNVSGSLDPTLFVDVAGKKALTLRAARRQVMKVSASSTLLSKLQLQNICPFDSCGNQNVQWPDLDEKDIASITTDDNDGMNQDASQDNGMTDVPDNDYVEMVTLLCDNLAKFDAAFNSNKSSSDKKNKTYRVILQDLLQSYDHAGRLALRIDPAGGVHTNALYSALQLPVNVGSIGLVSDVSGVNQVPRPL